MYIRNTMSTLFFLAIIEKQNNGAVDPESFTFNTFEEIQSFHHFTINYTHVLKSSFFSIADQITFAQSTSLQSRGFSSTHTFYSTPSAPPMIWSFSQSNEPQSTGYSGPSSYSGTGTSFGTVPPPPTYDESVSNIPLPPKY